MFSASTTSVSILQIVAVLTTILGFFIVEFSTLHVILLIITFYVFNILGISVTLHRYYSHKSFEFKHKFLKIIFTLISIVICRGSPMGWVYIHRLHHAFSDSDKDPHSPSIIGFKLFGLDHIHSNKINKFIIKDLMIKEQLDINKYYLLVILLYIVALALININLVYFLWALPVALVHIIQNSFNYFAHMHGYRNFQTLDNSTNNAMLFPFILGDAWHNNHHKNPALISNKVRWYEIDPAAFIINMIKK